MGNSNSEILFNKKNLKAPLEQSPSTAKKILYILDEGKVVEKAEDSAELINLYTKRINKPSHSLSKKISSNDFRPFEFLVVRN
ncbi:MAG: hypothetical protein IPK62_03905 [Bacteroidetes bacterium]|jgi:hypothetical protein|nr:hypothetical protein [Bacteroidota bacterium]MBK8144190.1 hypothetical protein [Bacteroidota bacterium]MBP6316101.1 hypothetical protein [Chitinophagaceae bacterium]